MENQKRGMTMPVKSNREYRSFLDFRALDNSESNSYIVEGYASTFDPYALFTDETGLTIYEKILPTAFDNTDMSDVIMQYDHSGRVFARNSNNTLQLSVDNHGLKMRGDLSSTTTSRSMYEDIHAGLITKMSFAFTVPNGGDYFDYTTNTRIITNIGKLYDVSAVSRPANPGTEIDARSIGCIDGAIERRMRESHDAECRKKMILKARITEREINGN